MPTSTPPVAALDLLNVLDAKAGPPAPPSLALAVTGRFALDELPRKHRQAVNDHTDADADQTLIRQIMAYADDGGEHTRQHVHHATNAALQRLRHEDAHSTHMRPHRAAQKERKANLADRHVHCPRAQGSACVEVVQYDDGFTDGRSMPVHCKSHTCEVCGPHAEHEQLAQWMDRLDHAFLGPLYIRRARNAEEAAKYLKAIGRIEGASHGSTPLVDGCTLIVSTHQIAAGSPLEPMDFTPHHDVVDIVLDAVSARHEQARRTGTRSTQRQRFGGAWSQVATSSVKTNRKRSTCQTWIEKGEAKHGPVVLQERLVTTSTSLATIDAVFDHHNAQTAPVRKQKHAKQHTGFDFSGVVTDLRREGFIPEQVAQERRQAAAAGRQLDAFTERIRAKRHDQLASSPKAVAA